MNDLRVRSAEKDLAAAAGRSSKIETKESQMELRWKQRDPRWSSDGSKRSKGSKGSKDWLPRTKPRNPKIESKQSPRNSQAHKKTGHNWSVFKIYRELNDYSATTSNEKVPFTFL